MVLKNTYFSRRRSGFSIIEYLVTMTIIVVVVALGAAVSENFMRSVAFLTNAVDLDAKNRLAIDRMSREIRGCDAVYEAWNNGLVLRSGTNLTTFEYFPATRELIRANPDTGTEVYLKGCDYVRFALFGRTNLSSTYANYDIFPSASTTNCKIVQITWVCSRRMLGFKATTGRMQSARVVIRNQ
jgi:prepilin-type N-terminal cleavage/methylation domain-containing protein